MTGISSGASRISSSSAGFESSLTIKRVAAGLIINFSKAPALLLAAETTLEADAISFLLATKLLYVLSLSLYPTKASIVLGLNLGSHMM